MAITTKRARRSDRNHIIYLITCLDTGDTYIGLTVMRYKALRGSLEARWKGHVYHAIVEGREGLIGAAIRQYGTDIQFKIGPKSLIRKESKNTGFRMEILDVVRGKALAHTTEVYYIKTLRPTLNIGSNR
jgi:hypothetical protein